MTNELMDLSGHPLHRHDGGHCDAAIHVAPAGIAASPASSPEGSAKNKNGWTDERRMRQREAIRRWSPWRKSTGPKSASGKARSARNAVKHGYRGREWQEFHALLALQRAQVRHALRCTAWDLNSLVCVMLWQGGGCGS